MAATVFSSAVFASWMTTDDAPLASVKAHVVATVDAAGQHRQAAPFTDYAEMPETLALDGLHGDVRAKQMMAAAINASAIWKN